MAICWLVVDRLSCLFFGIVGVVNIGEVVSRLGEEKVVILIGVMVC